MRVITAVLTLLALTLVLVACAHEQRQAQTSQSDLPGGTVLVKRLPAGAEGLELKEGSLRLKPGYSFVKQSGHRFAVARMSGGQPVTSGGCGCTGGTCDPVLKGGIIVCEASGCTGTCGLALTVAGVNTKIIKH
jgi:hypothetical protein